MAKKQQKQPNGFQKLVLYGIGALATGGILYLLLRWTKSCSRNDGNAAEGSYGRKRPASSKEKIREIMQNIDLMPPNEIYKVRRDLGRSLGQLSKQSAEKYVQLNTSEQAAFLDEGIEKMQLARALFEATNQGGMPTRTQADAERYQRYREEREAAKQNPEQSKAKKRKLEDGEKKKPKPEDGAKKKPKPEDGAKKETNSYTRKSLF